jgi:hypothetical protein
VLGTLIGFPNLSALFLFKFRFAGLEIHFLKGGITHMAKTKVFADRYTQDFSSATDFFEFLAQRKENSSWMKAPSKELTFQSVERDSPTGDLFSKLYNANGCGDLMEDTMENTNLLMMVNGQDYPVRSCAIKTILERARISGHALSKVSSEVFSQILNYCMGVAAGQSLITQWPQRSGCWTAKRTHYWTHIGGS